MGDEHQCRARTGIELKQQINNALAGAGIKVPGGFIGEQYRRLSRKSPGNGNSLLLTSRQRGGIMPQPVLQPDLRQKTLGNTACLINACQFEREHYVLLCGQRGEQLEVLKNEAHFLSTQPGTCVLIQRAEVHSVEPHLPGGSYVHAREQSQQCRLTGTGSTDNRSG